MEVTTPSDESIQHTLGAVEHLLRTQAEVLIKQALALLDQWLRASAALTAAAQPAAEEPETPGIHDLTRLPPVLIIADMARIYRRSLGTIRRDLQNGTFRPAPFAKRPYRWIRDDIIEDLQRKSRAGRMAELNPTIQPRRRPRRPTRAAK